MPCKYDPDTLTLFDLETGASVATIHVPDNGSFEEAHRIGYLMAAAEGMREAIKDVETHVNSWTSLLKDYIDTLPDGGYFSMEDADKSYAKHELHAMQRDLGALVVALRAAEPPR